MLPALWLINKILHTHSQTYAHICALLSSWESERQSWEKHRECGLLGNTAKTQSNTNVYIRMTYINTRSMCAYVWACSCIHLKLPATVARFMHNKVLKLWLHFDIGALQLRCCIWLRLPCNYLCTCVCACEFACFKAIVFIYLLICKYTCYTYFVHFWQVNIWIVGT